MKSSILCTLIMFPGKCCMVKIINETSVWINAEVLLKITTTKISKTDQEGPYWNELRFVSLFSIPKNRSQRFIPTKNDIKP